MNRWTASRHEVVSKLSTNSKCTARPFSHVNRYTHFFTVRRNIFTSKGPKSSTPVFVNGRTLFITLSIGRSTICGGMMLAKNRHCTKLCLTDRRAFRNPIIQIFFCTRAELHRALQLLYSLTALCLLGKITGCFVSYGKTALRSLPFALKISLESMKGTKETTLLFGEIVLLDERSFLSVA